MLDHVVILCPFQSLFCRTALLPYLAYSSLPIVHTDAKGRGQLFWIVTIVMYSTSLFTHTHVHLQQMYVTHVQGVFVCLVCSRKLEWRHLQITLNEDNTIDVSNILSNSKEHLG